VTSSWFFLSTLNDDARSTTHQILECVEKKNIIFYHNTTHNYSHISNKMDVAKNRIGGWYFGRPTSLQRVKSVTLTKWGWCGVGSGTTTGVTQSCLSMADTVALRIQSNFFQTFTSGYFRIRLLIHGSWG